MPDTSHSVAALDDASWFRTLAERTGNPMVVTDPAGRIIWANAAFSQRTGYPLAVLRGQRPGAVLQCPQTDPEAVGRIRTALAEGRAVREAIENRISDTQADLLVMGAYSQSRLKEFFFGGATRTLLQSMPVATLMSR